MDETKVSDENLIKFTFKKRPQPSNNQSIKLNLKNQNNLKLSLIKKDRNSPFLSIQKFIHQQIKDQSQIADLRKLWAIYEKQTAHSIIIKNHEINYNIFREIAENILETLEPYQIQVSPIYLQKSPRVSLADLKDYVL